MLSLSDLRMQGVYGNHLAPSNAALRSALKQLFPIFVYELGVLRVSPWTAGQMADNDGCRVDACGFKLRVLLRVIAKMMHSGYGGLQLLHR